MTDEASEGLGQPEPAAEATPHQPGPEEVIGTVEDERIRTGEMIGAIMQAKEQGTDLPISVADQIDRMDGLYHVVASRFDELLDAGHYAPVLGERSTVVGMRLGRLTSDHPDEAARVQPKIDARAAERNRASEAREAVKPPTPGTLPPASTQ